MRPLLHPDVVFRFSDADCVSTQAVQEYFENAWSIVHDERYEAIDVAWRLPTPSTAIASYTYQWAGVIGGAASKGSGRATNVFVAGVGSGGSSLTNTSARRPDNRRGHPGGRR